MVVAGPGTGKTQILASRIAFILANTDSSAQNILCLTYTDAGTIAMRKRLVSMIGNDAHRVSIHTFHSFCNRVIQENKDYFDYKSLEPVSDLERIEYLTQLSLDLPDDHPLKKMKGNVGYLVSALSRLFEWMKMENVTPDQIAHLTAARKVEMEEGDEFRYKRKYKEFNKGDLNLRKLEEAHRKLDELVAASALFHIYEDFMSDNGRYDYSDMILWVIRLFETTPQALSRYQEVFHYILVDEYQDTSGSQNTLLHLLLNYWDRPNVFVVGDDDQSIYRFQGAEIKNVIDFVETYSQHLTSILLKTNYRSTQPILNAAKRIIDLNQERLVRHTGLLDKDLASHKDPGNVGSRVQLVKLENEYLQAYWVVQSIKKAIDNGSKPEDFAIIYGKHAYGELTAELLKQEQIPVFLKRSDNILHSESVVRILSVLTYINKENRYPFSGAFELFELLHLPHFGIQPISLARLSYYLNKNRSDYKGWRDFLDRLSSIDPIDIGISPNEHKRTIDAALILEGLVAFSANESLFQLVTKVVQSLDLSGMALQTSQFTFELESIISFLNFTELELETDNKLDLDAFLTKIELMNHHRLAIGKEHIVYDKNGVNLLTAHASKGLEFQHVYVLNCVASAWEKKRRMPLPFSLQQLYAKDRDDVVLEEVRRLFYVAMTRAETSLNLVYFSRDKSGKEIARSEFLDELDGVESVEHIAPELNYDKARKVYGHLFTEASIKKIDLLDPPFLDEYLETYQLSVSHLNNYIECPTKFYFQNILRVPAPKNVYMSFGIAIHNAMDHITRLYNEQSPEFTDQKLRELYEFYLKKEKAVFSEKDYDGFLSLGKNILTDYFETTTGSWKAIEKIETEVLIDRVVVDGVPIKGQLDRIEVTGKTVNVVDFKTGDAERGVKKMRPPKENADESDSLEKRFGGSYWRQIMFYSLLVNGDSSRDTTMISGEMAFIEPVGPGEFIREKVMITPMASSIIRHQVKDVYDRIRNRDFLSGCKKEDCYWCNFVSTYYSVKKQIG